MIEPRILSPALETLQREAFNYFLHEVNPSNGLVRDKTQEGSLASIAAIGLALSVYPVGVERGWMTRSEASDRTLTTLKFFQTSHQGPETDATGYKGFYYHFLEMQTGKRCHGCELSTIDTAFLLAGMLTAAAYFTNEVADEHEIRTLADELYSRVDWRWAQDGGATVTHGWKPKSGFLSHRWQGYDEALFLYLLGLGSPTYPLPPESYAAWLATYRWRKVEDINLLDSGPLFTHQISHLWVDFRGIQDQAMREHNSDYFENSRRATQAQQRYAIRNPCQFQDYGENCWGISASDGPGWVTRTIKGRKRRFFDYEARGIPDGPDDGTLAPYTVAASLPFAPEIVVPALYHFAELALPVTSPYGSLVAFNPTFATNGERSPFWVTSYHYGINVGPIALMLENVRSDLVWRLIRQCPYFVSGLRRAGFVGGWLDK
jgi:hypothetical protein